MSFQIQSRVDNTRLSLGRPQQFCIPDHWSRELIFRMTLLQRWRYSDQVIVCHTVTRHFDTEQKTTGLNLCPSCPLPMLNSYTTRESCMCGICISIAVHVSVLIIFFAWTIFCWEAQSSHSTVCGLAGCFSYHEAFQ